MIFQQQVKHVTKPHSRQVLPRYPMELPKLNVAVPTSKVPYPVSSLPALSIPHQRLLPAITSKKYHFRTIKVNAEYSKSTHRDFLGFCVIVPSYSLSLCYLCFLIFLQPGEEPHRSTLKSYYMPPLERKGGGY